MLGQKKCSIRYNSQRERYFRTLIMIGKFQVLSICAALIAISSCKEENPGIVFTVPEKPLLDTTYTVGAVPAAQLKNVLLLDITGVRCNNCPEAAATARKIADTLNPGRVVVLALYSKSPSPSLTAPWSGYDTMTTDDAEALVVSLGSVPALPIGSVDQVKVNNTYFMDRATWVGNVSNRLTKSTPLNIDLHTEWLTADNKSRAEIKVTYTAAVSQKHLMFIGIMESHVEGKQSDKTVQGGIDEKYMHNHALRKMITPFTGDTLNAALTAGRVFEKHYYISPRYNWKPENLEIVVWVVDADTKEVIHVSKEELKK